MIFKVFPCCDQWEAVQCLYYGGVLFVVLAYRDTGVA